MPRKLSIFCAVALTLFAVKAAAAEDIIGQIQTYTINEGDVFVDIARNFDLGYNALRAANPGVDAWIPPIGSEITLPLAHILPDAPRRGIVINLAEERLYFYPANGEVRSFPIGVVKEGFTMPLNAGKIIRKREHPSWIPPPSVRRERPDLPKIFPPGPDNPLGDYALDTSWAAISIHGTNKPMGVGRRVSHGCIRLYPEDIAWLFANTEVGVPVMVVYQPIKTSWQGDKLYLEVHPRMEDADAIEDKGFPLALDGNDNFVSLSTAMVLKAAKDQVLRIDWDLVDRLIRARDGLPHQITIE